MATIMIEGFDKYGPENTSLPYVTDLLPMGGWTISTSLEASNINIGPGLAAPGYSLRFGPTVLGQWLSISRNVTYNAPRLIGGFRFNSDIEGDVEVTFIYAGLLGPVTLCYIRILQVSGTIAIVDGLGNLLEIGLLSVAGNTVHYLEFDITFGVAAEGGWTVWLDGVETLHGNGTTATVADHPCNVFQLKSYGGGDTGSNVYFDDLYLFDDTTDYNKSALLSNPAIITQMPIGDQQTQFPNDGNVVGYYFIASGLSNNPFLYNSSYTPPENSIYLAFFTPSVNCTVFAISVSVSEVSGSTNPTANFKGVLYNDSSGVPNALLTTGSQVTGCSSGQPIILPLEVPINLIAGTRYWLGFITDSAVPFQDFDTTDIIGFSNNEPLTLNGSVAGNSYVSGAPAEAPTMTPLQPTLGIYGICIGATTNWQSEAVNPPIGNYSSVSSATPGVEDLYIFPALPLSAIDIYTVAVSSNCALSQLGTHSFDLVAVSGGTSGYGTNVDIVPTTNFAWYDTYFDTDPNTSAPWTANNVTHGYYGMEIVS